MAKMNGLVLDRLIEEARQRGTFESQCKYFQARENNLGYEHAKTQELLRQAQGDIASRETQRKASEPLIRELHNAATSMLGACYALIGRNGRPKPSPRPELTGEFILTRARLMKALEASTETCDLIPF